ncbi:MAG TPA: NHL repeat-containing protein, partial [Pontiella sp.]|nr:NHL repeat-containing protein [Pontiella sp.]
MSRNEPSDRACKGLKMLGPIILRMAAAGFFLLAGGMVQGADLSVLHANESPTRLAQGPEGSIYATDPKAGSVFIYDSSLTLTGELKNLNVPLGIAVGMDGTIFVGCQGTRSIQAYTATGDFIRTIGDGVLGKPSDIALDLYGNLYVADSPAHCVRIYNMNGGHLGDIGSFGTEPGEFNFPAAV